MIDVALFLAGRPPVRDSAWTDLPVRAGRSVALDVGSRVLGESIVGVDVTATRGRIAVGSLAVRGGGSVRSTIASSSYASSWILPVAGGAGGGIVSLLVPGDLGVRFGATLLQADEEEQTAGNLALVRQGGTSTVSAPFPTVGPSAVIVTIAGEGEVVAGLRAAGPGQDDAATGGTATPAPGLGGAAHRRGGLSRSRARPGQSRERAGDGDRHRARRRRRHGLDHGRAAADRFRPNPVPPQRRDRRAS